ncbi:MAG: ferredoxin--NADP reductase [Pseudomonadota bacterium]
MDAIRTDQASAATDEAPILVAGQPTGFDIPAGVFAETVTEVKHYTDRLFKFRITRPQSFRFRSGEFVMIGLPNAERPVFRAYSIASPAWDEELEFFSIKVPDGPLTEHLQKIQPGDTVLMRKKPTGTLVNDALLPGKRLWMFSTGTGIAPFASLIRDPETYEKFETVILTHTCREVAELGYGHEVVEICKTDPLVGEFAGERLVHYTTVTREDFPRQERITDALTSGSMFEHLGLPKINPEEDRGMICGSMAMLNDTKAILESFGLVEGANNAPATFVVERAFVG